jgi:hypothetical protein
VLVALQNEALDSTYEELSTEYPKVEFRKVSKLQLASSSICTATHVFPCTPRHAAAAISVMCTLSGTYCFLHSNAR